MWLISKTSPAISDVAHLKNITRHLCDSSSTRQLVGMDFDSALHFENTGMNP
jgi:hypothetical protein